jgi:uncharacterized protein YjbJ (UPF0337 family)
MRSARKDTSSGTVDKIAGRIMEAFGKVTGRRKTKAKGKAARGRGAGRKAKGRAKRAGR